MYHIVTSPKPHPKNYQVKVARLPSHYHMKLRICGGKMICGWRYVDGIDDSRQVQSSRVVVEPGG